MFAASRFASWMDRCLLEDPGRFEPAAPDDELLLLRRRGIEHEAAHEASLRAAGHEIADPSTAGRSFATRHEATLAALRAGAPFVRQAALGDDRFQGYADLLVREPGASGLGDWRYRPREIKLGVTPRPKYLLQACAYVDLLAGAQGVRPETFELLLGRGDVVTERTADHLHRYRRMRADFLAFMDAFDSDERPRPEPGEEHGRWTAHAEAYLDEVDDLSRVATIRRTQIARLRAAGIDTVAALAASGPDRVPRLDPATFARLRRQARLQIASRDRDTPAYEILAPEPDAAPRGLALLPPESPGDVYFDMEGDPHADGGSLEYLFGATVVEDGEPRFHDWWAHDRAGERAAFEGFVDWVTARLRAHPDMHVYHYASYEMTALKRLMGSHATREPEIDRLLRREVFVDLYAVVRGGLAVGTRGYSIKDLERLYREGREGQVTSAVGSIVQYRRWLDAGEPRDWRRSPILRGIRDYNRDDCESTWQLATWLRARQREAGIAHVAPAGRDDDEQDEDGDRARARALAERLFARGDARSRLVGHLVEFHRREDRPRWWEHFRRMALDEDELVEDLSCLGALTRRDPPRPGRGGTADVAYAFDPDQDTKLDAGDRFHVAREPGLRGEILALDRERGRVDLRFARKSVDSDAWPPPATLSLVPDDVYFTGTLVDSIARTAGRVAAGGTLGNALEAFVARRPPSIAGHDGGALLRDGEPLLDGCVRLAAAMDDTTLTIQGPPGSGKTYTAAHMIAELVRRGRRVGVTSTSHKAVLNLMAACARHGGGSIRQLKVGGDGDDPLLVGVPGLGWERSSARAAGLLDRYDVVGGTAWLFARPEMAGRLDHLFVDEAGQVSLGNLVAAAPAASNLVLVGDQMQLAQPSQAVHPGDAGLSPLEYLLGDAPTVPDDRGVFLDTTWRLHPELCRFVSESFYEGRLRAAPGCERQRVAREGAAAGIVHVPVEHEGNTQGSVEEAEAVRALFRGLVGREWTDREGARRRLGVEDVLVVAPYTMQVRLLRERLPAAARIGSVDRFQGQEAPVVIVSMCASEGHDSPRGLDFVLNPNRLNVAVSRARALAFVVGHPGLARAQPATAWQARLVNLYCRIAEEGSAAGENPVKDRAAGA